MLVKKGFVIKTIRHGVSPVMYVHRGSQQTKRLNELIKVFTGSSKQEDELLSISNVADEMIDSFKYIKPYQGVWHKGKRIRKPLTYYNEREWRYCPLLNEYSILPAKFAENRALKDKLSGKLRKELLKFSVEDVKFIIIKNKESIGEITQVLDKMKLDKKQRNELVTKIITFEEIKEDY
jgi:hypothetical protein